MSGWRRRAGESPGEAARRLIARITEHGTPRCEARGRDLITSVGSERLARQSLKGYLLWRISQQIPQSEQDYQRHLVRYLTQRAKVVCQKVLNCDRRSLGMVFHVRLPRIAAERATVLTSRSYRLEEVQKIALRQDERHQVSTWLCFDSGVRAHELATLVRRTELAPSAHRVWRPDRFLCFAEHELYVVVGKGGLVREVAVLRQLAQWLERHRRPCAVRVRDREVNYQSNYDIGFGQAASQSFSTASQKALGWSNGMHGLRHSYAKSRFAMLCNAGLKRSKALEIVSQEMGHFRKEVMFSYLR
ncbi:MAG TPA: hypothetical protein VNF69_06045 [Burkholderiales bacterium]|nr:hypothetical protein [Burkholderiales bacterium]